MSALHGNAPAAPAESPTGSPRALSTSLQAAATLNAGLQHEPSSTLPFRVLHSRLPANVSVTDPSTGSISRNDQSPSAGRRRSTVILNLQHNDPSVPAPGEMVGDNHHGISPGPHAATPPPLVASPQLLPGGDPHHNRTPSLGELHQELEAEQEAQVVSIHPDRVYPPIKLNCHQNRLLHTIRQQQAQLQTLQGPQGADESAVLSEIPSNGTPGQHPKPAQLHSISHPRSPSISHHPRSSLDMARADLHRRSRTPSRGASPRMRSTSISGESDHLGMGGRDENAFYQAETQMLMRENQMLRHRIRDLGTFQISNLTKGSRLLT